MDAGIFAFLILWWIVTPGTLYYMINFVKGKKCFSSLIIMNLNVFIATSIIISTLTIAKFIAILIRKFI